MEEIENIEIIEDTETYEIQQVDYSGQLVEIQDTLINQSEIIKGTNSILLILCVFCFISFIYKLLRYIF